MAVGCLISIARAGGIPMDASFSGCVVCDDKKGRCECSEIFDRLKDIKLE